MSHPNDIPPAYAALASIYDLPPCPPRPPLLPDLPPQPPRRKLAEEYPLGLMMAALRIKAVLGLPPTRHPATGRYIHKVIPGWTDGSDKWRPSIYSFAFPHEDVAVIRDETDDRRNNAYRGFVSTPCKSRGLHSTLGNAGLSAAQITDAARELAADVTLPRVDVDQQYLQWHSKFSARCESRSVMYEPRSRVREVPIVAKQAAGKLLIPDVKLKRRHPAVSLQYAS